MLMIWEVVGKRLGVAEYLCRVITIRDYKTILLFVCRVCCFYRNQKLNNSSVFLELVLPCIPVGMAKLRALGMPRLLVGFGRS
jgi:hypothetical protein